jgi:hypothetical protein
VVLPSKWTSTSESYVFVIENYKRNQNRFSHIKWDRESTDRKSKLKPEGDISQRRDLSVIIMTSLGILKKIVESTNSFMVEHGYCRYHFW